PNARIVFSGGSGALLGEEVPESQVARGAFAQLGIDRRRVSYEEESRNTWENLLYSHRMFRPKSDQVWILATSASQLPRAMEVARRLKWKLIPWPSDYRTPVFHGGFISNLDLTSNLELLDIGLHEW